MSGKHSYVKRLKTLFPFSYRDLLVTVGILFCAVQICNIARIADSTDAFASPVFVLAVLLISRFTNGYLYGLSASVLGVVFVNVIFTYPYWKLNVHLAGYPLTFAVLFIVSIITCTLTTQTKQQDRLKAETEKERLRANLLRSVSHDIRTPLTSIVGATSTVLDNPGLSDSEQKELLEDVRSEAQWLIRVVENLLSITRIGEDPTHITKDPEAAEEVMGEAVRKFRRRFPTVSIKVSAPDELLLVPMDPMLIEQVLANLLENAVIHGKTTSSLQVSVQRKNGYACFSVQDNGQGIPDSLFPTLFHGGIKHNENSSSDGKRNMGLGLSVCLAIVRAHNGHMEAQNLDHGTEFRFYLPLSEEDHYEYS